MFFSKTGQLTIYEILHPIHKQLDMPELQNIFHDKVYFV